jgi:hypothetical protein
MGTEHLFQALAFFCLAAAAWVLFFRSGKWLKKNKREIEGIEKRLDELKPKDSTDSDRKSDT